MQEIMKAAREVWNSELPELEPTPIASNLERLATCKLAYVVEILALVAFFAALFAL